MRILTEIIGGTLLLAVFFWGVKTALNDLFMEKPDATKPVQPAPGPDATAANGSSDQQQPS